MLSLKPRSFVQSSFNMHAPRSPHVFLFSFWLFGDVDFSEYCLYHCRFLFVWRVRRTGYVHQSINQSITQSTAYVKIQSINQPIILPVVTKNLPMTPRRMPYEYLSRCKFSFLTTRQPIVELYLHTFPRFPLRKKEHKSFFDKNRTHDFRTSRCAGYLLVHSGDELLSII